MSDELHELKSRINSIPAKDNLSHLESEWSRVARWQEKLIKLFEDFTLETSETRKIFISNIGKKITPEIIEALESRIHSSLRKEVETKLVPALADVISIAEWKAASEASSKGLAKMEQLSKKINELEKTAARISDAASKTQSAIESLESPEYEKFAQELLAPLEQRTVSLRALAIAGRWSEAFSLAIQSPAAFEELLSSETPDDVVERVTDANLRRQFAVVVSKSLAEDSNLSHDEMIHRTEWILEIVISLRFPDEQNKLFLEELSETLGLVDTRGDRKTASKIAQLLKLVRSLQW